MFCFPQSRGADLMALLSFVPPSWHTTVGAPNIEGLTSQGALVSQLWTGATPLLFQACWDRDVG